MVDRVVLVEKLREVRVLRGFSRIDYPDRLEPGTEPVIPPYDEQKDWLPCVEVFGEGIFFSLDAAALELWSKGIMARSESIFSKLNRDRLKRHLAPQPTSPKVILLHSLSHLIMRQLALDCGYPASAMRERLYWRGGMAGVMIYTGSADRSGTLGGIVEQGEPAAFAHLLRMAVESGRWCSQDPICSDADPSQSALPNGAACHSCLYLPETSCELQNALLDRLMVGGGPGSPEDGFFSRLGG